MHISELLYVGTGPDTGEPEQRCATAQEAYTLVKQGIVAVVPTTDIAHQTLLLLGATPEHANFASRRASRYDFDVELM